MSMIRSNGHEMPSVSRIFGDDFLSRDLLNWGLPHLAGTGTALPAVNILENKDHFEVEIAAPGMKKSDFNIELNGNTLTISSARGQERTEKDHDRYTRREFSYQAFQRSFDLPRDVVDADKIKASYSDGILHLQIPKREEAMQKAPRMIRIS